MARIRSVHPGLFTDEAFVTLSSDSQMFLIGLWTEADDQGVFEWKPITLRMRLRPTKDGPVDALLDELKGANAVRQYEMHGKKYGAIRNFRKYQRPKSPNAVHPITDEIRNYVALTSVISEIEEDEAPPIPPNGEIPPQREEVGGKRKEEKKVSRAERPSASDDFERIWRKYPKRKGGNPRKPALRAFEAAIAAGVTVQAIEAGLERDIGVWTSEKAIGTRFIPQTVTWLQQARWDDHADLAPAASMTVGVPLMPGSEQFKAWYAAVPRKSLAYMLMTRADDTNQPYYAPSEWPPECKREHPDNHTEAA